MRRLLVLERLDELAAKRPIPERLVEGERSFRKLPNAVVSTSLASGIRR
jgi:hypothetical protein